jgi:hypothetical protein
MTSISRASPPTTSTRPTPRRHRKRRAHDEVGGFAPRGGVAAHDVERQDREVRGRDPLGLDLRSFGELIAGIRDRGPRRAAARSALSLPSSNCSAISAAPRMIRVRIRRAPGTLAKDSSRGRTTAACISAGVRSRSARDDRQMRGKSTSG